MLSTSKLLTLLNNNNHYQHFYVLRKRNDKSNRLNVQAMYAQNCADPVVPRAAPGLNAEFWQRAAWLKRRMLPESRMLAESRILAANRLLADGRKHHSHVGAGPAETVGCSQSAAAGARTEDGGGLRHRGVGFTTCTTRNGRRVPVRTFSCVIHVRFVKSMVYHLCNAWYRMLYEVYAKRISGTPRRNASNSG